MMNNYADLLPHSTWWKAKAADFHNLLPKDWAEVKKLFEAGRRYITQKYVNAMFACRMKGQGGRSGATRTYSEEEILSELAVSVNASPALETR